jgi:hypothetical protein
MNAELKDIASEPFRQGLGDLGPFPLGLGLHRDERILAGEV